MKKILSVLAVMLAVVMLTSCNSFERKAKEQMHKTMKEISKNPATLKISEENVMLSNDSICVIQFLASNKNELGGDISTYMEYVLINHKSVSSGEYKLLETLKIFDTYKDKKKSIGYSYKEMVDGTSDKTDSELLNDKMKEKNMSRKDAAADLSYHMAAIDCLTKGREVPKD